MGGKRKRLTVKPTASRLRTPTTLPTRYDFTPKSTSEAVPPVLPNFLQPSVKNYPPPKQLFLSSTSLPSRASSSGAPPSGASPSAQPQPLSSPGNHTAGRSTPLSRASPAAETRAPASSATRTAPAVQPQQGRSAAPQVQPSHSPQQSPHSSQAQNSHTAAEEEEEGDFSNVEAPVEPNLSQDQMEALNSLLLAPRPNKITILDPNLMEPDSTW